jgi:uncharacterized protein (TIGR00730 family)
MSENYKIGDPKIDAILEELGKLCVAKDCEHKFKEILATIIKLGMEHKDLGDFKLISSALKELRQAFKIYFPYRENRKVAVFGSSRLTETTEVYQLAESLGKQLADRGYMVITGAGGGVMEAANRGAGKDSSFGVNIKLPFEQEVNAFIKGDPKLMTFKYFFTRKLIFIKESHATVLLPGGFGTLDEGMECMTLFQTGKSMPRPIILLEPENGIYWDHFLDLINTSLIPKGYMSKDDRKLIQVSHSAEETVELIDHFYQVYHSLRYVRHLTVLRLNHEVSADRLVELNREFKDILVDGEIIASGPLKDELKNNEYPLLPRLVFHFNKKDFGRLNELILHLNNAGKEGPSS